MTSDACGAGNAYPSGAPDFTSGFHGGLCCPVICVSLFHVVVLSFGFLVLIVPFVSILLLIAHIYMLYTNETNVLYPCLVVFLFKWCNYCAGTRSLIISNKFVDGAERVILLIKIWVTI